MDKVKCVFCNSTMLVSDYDYNSGIIRYECEECGKTFSEDNITHCDECGEQVIEDERIDYDGMVFCCGECVRKYRKENNIND